MRLSFLEAVRRLNRGEVISIPTDTVYGLAASLNKPLAIEQLYELKQRPKCKPMVVQVSQLSDVAPYVVDFPPHFQLLATTFWPGPLTLVIPVDETRVPAAV